MKVKNGKIVEATEDELFGYWLKAEFCEIMSFGEYKQRCVELGTKVIKEMTDKLNPCPFCGKPVTFVYNSFDDAFKFSHKRAEDEENCCVIGEIWIKGTSLADAKKQWNRRVE